MCLLNVEYFVKKSAIFKNTKLFFNSPQEPAYTPQVEAISPTLPSEEGRCDSPMRVLKENILNNINRLDKEINQVESQVTKLQKKMVRLFIYL